MKYFCRMTTNLEGSIFKWGLLALKGYALRGNSHPRRLATKLVAGLRPRRKIWAVLGGIALTFTLQGCVSGPVPIDEYTLARSAIDAAKAVEAARYAPGYWNQAEEAFRRAKILLTEKENEEARIEFLRARLAAERAENSARYTRFKNGEVL